ncbi:MAG: HlyD family efflux transporter periplasmic adaptor subunit [Muribaculaceae bacterium]|nr:HlyD family efflux transporter periplasmic adaptor subunit [Muribaculaceae bacterium]
MDTEIKPRFPLLKKYGWIAVVALAITGVTVYAITSSGTKTYTTHAGAITTGDVTYGSFNDNIRLTGRIETGVSVQVSALETGIVESRPVEEGAFVNEGDVILTLRNPNLRQQILDSESQLAEKQNMLRDTEIAMEKERLQIKQELLVARTDLNRKRRNAEQQEALYNEKLTSREEYLVAKEDCQLAEENYRLLINRQHQDSLYRSVQLDMMRESLRNMQENFTLVRQRADNLNIRASHSGQLGSLNAELGQNIPAGTQVGQINILDNYRITVQIDEHYIDRVSAGLRGVARHRDLQQDLTLSKIYPEVTDGTFRADFIIDGNNTDNLRVGQTCAIDLILGEPSQAVMVPRGTFFQSTGGRKVYVLAPDGKSATLREIRLGRQNPQYFEVLEGLEPGERIITSDYGDFGNATKILIKD